MCIWLCVVLQCVNHYVDGLGLCLRKLVCSWRHVLQLYTCCTDCVVIEGVCRCLERLWLRLQTAMVWHKMNYHTNLKFHTKLKFRLKLNSRMKLKFHSKLNFHKKLNFHTFLQLSRCLSRWIHLSGLFVRSDPAVLRDIYISVTGSHSTYKVKWNKKVTYQLCVTSLQM